MAVSAVGNVTVKDSSATTNTISYHTDPNNSSYKGLVVVPDSGLCITPVYSCGTTELTAAASCTDIAVLTGSATKTLRVLKVGVGIVFDTAAIDLPIYLKKHTVANTGGTAVDPLPTITQYDSLDAEPTGVVTAYTANPTIDASATIIGSAYFSNSAEGVETNNYFEWDFSAPHLKPLILRGVAQEVAVNCGGVDPGTANIIVTFTWIEDGA